MCKEVEYTASFNKHKILIDNPELTHFMPKSEQVWHSTQKSIACTNIFKLFLIEFVLGFLITRKFAVFRGEFEMENIFCHHSRDIRLRFVPDSQAKFFF